MKRSKLADAILRGRSQELESMPEKPRKKNESKKEIKAATKTTRFHTTLYIDKDFHNRVKITLINEGRDRDFNRLINDLLSEWYIKYGDK